MLNYENSDKSKTFALGLLFSTPVFVIQLLYLTNCLLLKFGRPGATLRSSLFARPAAAEKTAAAVCGLRPAARWSLHINETFSLLYARSYIADAKMIWWFDGLMMPIQYPKKACCMGELHSPPANCKDNNCWFKSLAIAVTWTKPASLILRIISWSFGFTIPTS